MAPVLHLSLTSLLLEVARVSAWFFLLGIVFVPLERRFSERRQKVLRGQFRTDVAYYFLNGLVTPALVATLTGTLSVIAYHVMPTFVLHSGAHLTLWQRALATLVVGEFGFYWGHRWSHEWPLLWRFHAIHHTAEEVDWLTSSRSHPVDVLFTRFCGFALIYASGLAQPNHGDHATAEALMLVFVTFWGFFIHANVRWRLGWLEAVIATPGFHRWHHTNDEHRDMNYASTLPIYDRLFGTLYLPKRAAPPVYGSDTKLPDGFLGQLLSPLEPRS